MLIFNWELIIIIIIKAYIQLNVITYNHSSDVVKTLDIIILTKENPFLAPSISFLLYCFVGCYDGYGIWYIHGVTPQHSTNNYGIPAICSVWALRISIQISRCTSLSGTALIMKLIKVLSRAFWISNNINISPCRVNPLGKRIVVQRIYT